MVLGVSSTLQSVLDSPRPHDSSLRGGGGVSPISSRFRATQEDGWGRIRRGQSYPCPWCLPPHPRELRSDTDPLTVISSVGQDPRQLAGG